MSSSGVKYSGSKLVSQSDLRGGLSRETQHGKSTTTEAENTYCDNTNKDNTTRQLLIEFCNIRGIGHNNINVSCVHQHLQSIKPHILALSETQISPKSDSTYLLCPGYELHSKFRFKGGVCVYIRADVACQREESLEIEEVDAMWLRTIVHNKTRFICALYRSPNSERPSQLFQYLSDKVDWIQVNYPSSEIVILGDFNVHNSNWLAHSNKTDEAGRQAEAFAISCNLTQLVDCPTRVPTNPMDFRNTLDLYLSSEPDSYVINSNGPLGNSDHVLISVSCPLTAEKLVQPKNRRVVWHYNKAKWDELREFYAEYPWHATCFNIEDVSQCAEAVTEVILLGMELYIPHNTKKPPSAKPWFNKDCKRACVNKNKAFREWCSNPTDEKRAAYILDRNNCNLTIQAAKQAFNNRVTKKLLDCPSGSRPFWSLAKVISNNFCHSTFPPLLKDDGALATSSKEKADLFAATFAKNSTLEAGQKEPPNIPNVQASMPEVKFRTKSICRILKQLNSRKSTGPDGIPAIVLKECSPELAPLLCRLFKLSYEQKTFPNIWKVARVQPIPKKGKKCMPRNYRPISLLPILSKVMETAINLQIVKHLEENNLISDNQYGFRRCRSTGDLLTYVTHLWTNAIEKHGESIAVALDISKAFDRVWHRALLSKLPSYGLPEGLCSWLGSFLHERQLCVVVDGAESALHSVNAGVPQGSILSPTLFLMHINDLLNSTKNQILSFADDSTLIASTTNKKPVSASTSSSQRIAQAVTINKDLEVILQWGSDNLVEFNASKTQATVLTRKASTVAPQLIMDNKTIKPTNGLKLLGVNISPNATWHEHVSSVAKSAAQKLSYLFRARKLFTPKQLLLLYKAQVRPAMEYCSHAWGSAPKHSLLLLDSIQKRAVRLIDDPTLTANLHSLDHRRKVGDLCLFYRYYHGRCSAAIASIIPPGAQFDRQTRLANNSHQFAVHLSTARTSVYQKAFLYRTARLWNTLPQDVFPLGYNLQQFKTRTNRFLLNSSRGA